MSSGLLRVGSWSCFKKVLRIVYNYQSFVIRLAIEVLLKESLPSFCMEICA